MRLLVIAPHYNYFIKGQVEALAKYFDEIHVFVKYNPLIGIFSKLPLGGYQRYLLSYTIDKIVNLGGSPDNIKVHVISIPYIIPDGRNKKLGKKLANKITEHIKRESIQFDLIHAHFIYHYGVAGAIIKKATGKPLIVTVHGDDAYLFPFKDKEWYNIIKNTLSAADHIITVSRKNLNILTSQLGIPTNKISIIPNGFSASLFKQINKTLARKKLNLPLDRKIILNVASLVPVKGHEYLIQAMGKIVRQRKNVLLVIVGDGSLKTKLRQMVKRLGLDEYVVFAGAKPHSEVPLWMNAADLFVLPSLSEGNPTVMFEALGVGLPFVGTAVGGVPEVITSEDYGLLCPPKDPDCLAEKILIALDKEWDRKKIKKYAEQFTWGKIAKQVLKIYERVLEGEFQ